MKLSVENYVLRTQFGDKEALRMIAAAGFDAVDFSFYWMPQGENFLECEDYLASARQIKTWADECGLAISQAHAPFDLKLNDPADRQAYDRELIRRSIECAGVMGAQQIIVHNLTVSDPADFIPVNLAFFKSLEETARESNVRIAVENLWGRKDGVIVGGRLSTPEALSLFLDQLNPDHFCGCIDLGHAEIVGENSARFIRELGTPKLQALHVQDTDLKTDTHTLPYLGKHNWSEITHALADVRYGGDLTFEIFGYLKALPADALADALRLAHTIGRSLIANIENAAR